MATFLDFSILTGFTSILTWLLVWVIAFGVLDWVMPFGKDKKGFHAILAFVLAFFVLFSESARYIVEFAVPWFTVLAIVAFFVLFSFMTFGVKAETFAEWGATRTSRAWAITFTIIIMLFALGGAFGGKIIDSNGDPIAEYDENGDVIEPTGMDGRAVPANKFAEKVVLTVTHPKVLAVIFVLLLGHFTIVFLSRA